MRQAAAPSLAKWRGDVVVSPSTCRIISLPASTLSTRLQDRVFRPLSRPPGSQGMGEATAADRDCPHCKMEGGEEVADGAQPEALAEGEDDDDDKVW